MSLKNQHIFSIGSTETNKTQVNYLSRDFNSIRKDLDQYLRLFYPNEWQDFNIASPGMALVDLNAYVADLLSQSAQSIF